MQDEDSQKSKSTLNYWFPHVKELILKMNKIWSVDSIEHLSNLVNLSSLQKLILYPDLR
ncbi:unnamed protein product, partial [Rotaria sordida]